LQYFLGGELFEYAGARSVEEFALFATRLQLDSILGVTSEAALEDALADNGIAILLTMAPETQGDVLEGAFVRAAEKFRGSVRFLRWAGPMPADAAPATVQKLERGLSFGIPFEADLSAASPDEAAKALIDFVTFHNRPYITTITATNFKTLGTMGKNFLLAVLDISEANTENGVARHATELAAVQKAAVSLHSELSNNLVLGVLDSVRYAKYLKKYSATAPSLLLVNMVADSFFLFSESDHGVFDNQELLIQTLREANAMLPHIEGEEAAAAEAGAGAAEQGQGQGQPEEGAGGRRMKSLHHHVRKVGMLARLSKKFMDYFPYSFILCLIPALLLVMSVFMTSNPRNSKKKLH
jgi:hypothetical protein